MTVKVMMLLPLAIANLFSLNANIGEILSVPPLKTTDISNSSNVKYFCQQFSGHLRQTCMYSPA